MVADAVIVFVLYNGVAGCELCELLIKQFDKHCLSEQLSSMKISVYNTLRALLVFSTEAKYFALNGKVFVAYLFILNSSIKISWIY
jgi:hypothetical protein